MLKKKRLQTGVSQAFWCDYTEEKTCISCTESEKNECTHHVKLAKFTAADIHLEEKEPARKIAWFDEILDGGIVLPENGEPLTMLLSGPPGSGKTTLAMELCHRIAQASVLEKNPIMPLYISADTDSNSLIDNARELGWKFDGVIQFNPNNTESMKKTFQEKNELIVNGNFCPILVWGKENIKDWGKSSKIIQLACASIVKIPDVLTKALQSLNQKEIITKRSDYIKRLKPSILVIDSLNCIDKEELRSEYFTQFLSKIAKKNKNLKIIMIVLDSNNAMGDHSHWEYVVDTVIHLETDAKQQYYSRYLEIVKTRFQGHTLGKQFFKILPAYKNISKIDRSNCDYNIISHRNHPYRDEGGIFIYPSIHYYLSRYRKRTTPAVIGEHLQTPSTIGGMIKIPKGRCTAFVGERGTHKSHLAYVLLMNNIIQCDARGIIISLREDEKRTRETLHSINNDLYNLFKNNKSTKTKRGVGEYISDNRLEILHFLPGYITPNEFFHRLYINVHRMKLNAGNDKKNLIVVFNSLDEIGPRYPLCAMEAMFISGIITFLTGEGITSIFIGVDDDKHNIEPYGLLPMADKILSFKKEKICYRVYKDGIVLNQQINEHFNDSDDNKSILFGYDINAERMETTVEITKFSGGHATGSKGILELVEESKRSFLKNSGLFLTSITGD
jgi:KaiC/GvpD/RAD55 family RecA-like ATPase